MNTTSQLYLWNCLKNRNHIFTITVRALNCVVSDLFSQKWYLMPIRNVKNLCEVYAAKDKIKYIIVIVHTIHFDVCDRILLTIPRGEIILVPDTHPSCFSFTNL